MDSNTVKQRQDAAESLSLDESLFMKACRRQPACRTPIWLMRQAGRFMSKFREIRSRVAFLELCQNPELACEVTVYAVSELGVDAAIIFADILLPVLAMGLPLNYHEGKGPVISRPVRLASDVEALVVQPAQDGLPYVLEAITMTRRALPANIPLLGFAGAPFTMASYMIEGGSSRNYELTKSFYHLQPQAWQALMEKIVAVTAEYLNAQIQAGAQAVQLFDSWVGALSPSDYRRYVLPHTKALIAAVQPGVPVIHFGTGTQSLLPLMQEAGGDVIGLDWRVDLDEAWQRLDYKCAVQGNMDPCVLLSDRTSVRAEVKRILAAANGRPGHIFNLGHGVLPPTDINLVKYLVETVRELGGG